MSVRRKRRAWKTVIFLVGVVTGISLALLTGCVERQEIREQHCAHLSIERHGRDTYGTWTHGERCYTRLWDKRRVYEGKLDDRWRPE